MGSSSFMRILQICDSLFPVGAFTMSNGLESYVQKGIIGSAQELSEYLDSYISLLPFAELGAAAIAFNAAEDMLIRLDEVYTAARSAQEVRNGSQKIARRFFRLITPLPEGKAQLYQKLMKSGDCFGHQCIAYGTYMSDCGAPPEEALAIYGYSLCSAAVTNCVKLVPLSQVDGQRLLCGCLAKISHAAKLAAECDIDSIGIGGTGFELRQMQHERLYSRQYMS